MHVNISSTLIKNIVDFLNEREELDLTVEEVNKNEVLRNYLMSGGVIDFNEGCMSITVDIFECWNSDCYIDVEDYR